jgi:hypothetical protein
MLFYREEPEEGSNIVNIRRTNTRDVVKNIANTFFEKRNVDKNGMPRNVGQNGMSGGKKSKRARSNKRKKNKKSKNTRRKK